MLQDFRFAIRSLARRKALFLMAVATLAVGVGASTSLFSMVNGVLLQPLPYRDADRLAVLWHVFGQGAQDLPAMHPLDYRDYRDRAKTLEELTLATGTQGILGGAVNPEIVTLGSVNDNFFPFLGINPTIGRHFRREESVPGGPRVMLLSHGLWQRRFGSDPSVVGTRVELDGVATEIVGVMPPDFHLELPVETYALRDSDVWRPVQIDYARLPPRNFTGFTVFARLRPGTTFDAAQEELGSIAAQLRKEVPEHAASDLRVKVIPFHHDVVKGHRSGLWTLMAAVCLVLALACANVALLMLGRALGRDRELLVRVAVGASRARIVRLVFAENLIVAAVGGLLGVALARVSLLVINARALSTVPRLEATTVDLTVLLFALGASAISALAFGVAPALRSARVDLAESLRAAAVGSGPPSRGHIREVIIVTQIALGLVLVVGAGLVVQSFRALAEAHPGFDPAQTITMRVATPRADLKVLVPFHHDALERLRSLPDVVAAGAISQLPLTGQGPLQPYAFDAETARNWEQLSADNFGVTPGYFAAIRATIVAGRDFTWDDVRNQRRVIVIDDSLARRAFGGSAQAVGRRLQLEPEGTEESFFEIIGAVGHMRYHDLRRAILPQIYQPGVFANFSIALRTGGDPTQAGESARRAIEALRQGTAVQNVRLLSDIVDDALGPMRLAVWLMAGFGVIALTLAAVGIYGVFSYFVGERTREIAVRLALGATPSDIRGLVVRRGERLLALGLGIGLTGALAITGAAASLLYEVSAFDAPTYLLAIVFLAAVAMAACWLPARRASRVDPLLGLRQA
jgi:predicted permease